VCMRGTIDARYWYHVEATALRKSQVADFGDNFLSGLPLC